MYVNSDTHLHTKHIRPPQQSLSSLRKKLTLASERSRAKPSPTPHLDCFCKGAPHPEQTDQRSSSRILVRRRSSDPTSTQTIQEACIPARQQSRSSPATLTRSSPVPVEKSIIKLYKIYRKKIIDFYKYYIFNYFY